MFNEYYRLKAAELLNELSQVRTFIKRHGPTIGILTEEILRNFLATYLPKGISVEQGFIIGDDGTLSKQIDILIYDSQLFAPLYRINNIVVVPSASVLAIVEVKTTVKNAKFFHDIINYFYSVSQQLNDNTKKYLFIYNSASISNLTKYFLSFKHLGESEEFDHDTFQYLPDAITAINTSFFLKKDLITFDSDKIGYSSHQFSDKTNKSISSLEIFYKDIFEIVFKYINSKAPIQKNHNFTSNGKLESISAIELFDM